MTLAAYSASARRVSRWSASSSDTKLFGCFAATKIAEALSIPTVWSRGACSTSSALRRLPIASCSFVSEMSSTKPRLMTKGRPPSVTSDWPVSRIASTEAPRACSTCEGSAGAPMVTTARLSGIREAAASTAAPPSEWPISMAGGAISRPRHAAAATRSSTLEEKFVLANSPCEWPSPVKSKRSTAIPRSASVAAMARAAAMSLEQVKQCANSAVARGLPRGMSRRAASIAPLWPGNSIFRSGMESLPRQERMADAGIACKSRARHAGPGIHRQASPGLP